MSKRNPCPGSPYRTGAHSYEPDETSADTFCSYLGSFAKAEWACRYCGKRITFDGQYAAAPRRA